MPTRDLHYCELVEIGQRIQKRELSPVEATQAQLDRIARLDGQLKSYAYVMASSALEQAHAAEREIGSGKVRGPLHGVPIAVKDLCWTKDAPTAAGMRIYRDNRPTQDATVVTRLKEAGAVILGQLQLTWGRVSRYGVFELAATLDHIGPMARSAVDCGAILGAIAGADPNDPTAVLEPVPDYLADLSGSLRGTRIGVDRRWSSEGVDAAATKVFQDALRVAADLGAEIHEIVFPDPTAMITDWFPLCGVETAVAHEATYPSRKPEYGPGLAGLIDLGLQQSGKDYQKIVLRREAFKGMVKALFEKVDLLAVPAQTFAAPTLTKMATLGENPELIAGLLRFSCPFDMTGSPTITLSGGFTESGGPVAFQFVGRHLDEARLVAAGDAFQRVTDWHRCHPSLG